MTISLSRAPSWNAVRREPERRTLKEPAMSSPMLASPALLDRLKYPVYVSPKYDGIRAIVRNKQVLSRKLLPIPNVYVQRMYRDFEGLDGELIVGRPTDKGVFQATTSGVMSINGEPDIKFYVFDDVTYPEHTYEVRRARLTARFGGFQGAEDDLVCVPQVLIHNERQLLAEEKRILELGYEGVMIRDPLGRYKFGRSTAREGALLKLKRFEDAEAEIILVLPELHNTNVATRDELGRTKRSKEMAGLVPKNIAGVFHVRGVNGMFKDAIFNVTGFTAQQKAEFWEQRDKLPGKIIKYKFFVPGSKDAPRHPGFVGFRDKRDM